MAVVSSVVERLALGDLRCGAATRRYLALPFPCAEHLVRAGVVLALTPSEISRALPIPNPFYLRFVCRVYEREGKKRSSRGGLAPCQKPK